ncbi:GNAT family N-acetyltransferase [Erysipelotrichaceae bacterium OttesenSCG-928-M19]|nr:GNAT family N-acetyltransferase [Erysipelotrichaceae bacterium OttesenSCG-928-M19]
MREIKKLTLDNLEDYVDLAYNAYPSFKDNSKEGRKSFSQLATLRITDPDSHFMGMFEDDKLIAAMRMINFKMNFFGKIIPASGLASVAVHLMHKKEKIAKTLVEYYEEHYLKQEIPIASLLPFTPEFYKKMGYGLGIKMNQYRIPAKRFPAYYDKVDLRFLKASDDMSALLDFHQSIVNKTHGMYAKIIDERFDLAENLDNRIIVSYDENKAIDGYMIFEFINGKDDNYTINNMHIRELQYSNSQSLDKFLGFIKKQEDQVNLVIYESQDEYFAHKIDNPLNDSLNYVDYGNLETNTQLIGIMYKILDVRMAFKQAAHRNYNNVNLAVCFEIKDEKNLETQTIVAFKGGQIDLDSKEYDVLVKMSIVDFSSLFVGCISAIGLYKLGLLKLDKPECLEQLDLAFYCQHRPICNTDF